VVIRFQTSSLATRLDLDVDWITYLVHVRKAQISNLRAETRLTEMKFFAVFLRYSRQIRDSNFSYCLTFIGSCILTSIVKPTRCTNVSNLLNFGITLHVSYGLSVHHQGFTTVHTATGVCQKGTAAAACLGSRRQYLFDLCLLLFVQSLTPDGGWKDRPKYVELFQNKIK